MTRQQIAEAGSVRRSTPLTSRTAWALYVSQALMAIFLHGCLWAIREGAVVPFALIVGGILGTAALGISGIAGIAWTDDAVSAIRALRGMPEPAPAPAPKDPAP